MANNNTSTPDDENKYIGDRVINPFPKKRRIYQYDQQITEKEQQERDAAYQYAMKNKPFPTYEETHEDNSVWIVTTNQGGELEINGVYSDKYMARIALDNLKSNHTLEKHEKWERGENSWSAQMGMCNLSIIIEITRHKLE